MISSSFSSSFDESKIIITKSASLTFSKAFSTPIFSTVSSVSLIPAVSIIFKGTPLILTYSSMVSLVVPGTSVTIARFSFNRKFIRDDFPTFGFPSITVFMPSFNIFPVSAVFMSLLSSGAKLLHKVLTLSIVISSSSYSGKSMLTSIFANNSIISFITAFICFDNLPSKCFTEIS